MLHPHFFVLTTHINDNVYETIEYQSLCTGVKVAFGLVATIAPDGIHVFIIGMGFMVL